MATNDQWDHRLVTELDHWLRQERTAQAQQLRVVRTLRDQGCPWSVIGMALGTTKQGAQQRFTKAARGLDRARPLNPST